MRRSFVAFVEIVERRIKIQHSFQNKWRLGGGGMKRPYRDACFVFSALALLPEFCVWFMEITVYFCSPETYESLNTFAFQP
jgi:hypothetical protein